MVKFKQILWVAGVVAVFVVLSILMGFNGTENLDYSYVKVEVNPQVEFISDNKNNVVSVYALNNDGKVIIANEDFVGLKIEDAVTKVVDLCAKTNYLDVSSKDNAVKLTVVAGLTQALETNIYKEVNSYIKNNAINCVIVENPNDLNQFKRAKKLGVCCNKMALVDAVSRFEEDKSIDEIKKLKEKQLISTIKDYHNSLNQQANLVGEFETKKQTLIMENSNKIKNHNDSLSDSKIAKYKDDYKMYKIENLGGYETDYDAMVLKNTQKREHLNYT